MCLLRGARAGVGSGVPYGPQWLPDAWCDQRPRAVPLDREGDVEEQLVGVVAGQHLHADRQPVDVPAGIDTAGLP